MPSVHARLVSPCALALAVLAASAIATPTAAQPSARPHYALRARLDPEAGVLHGHVHVRWRNRSAAPVRELYFHLYANAFEHAETLFMREGGRRLRGGRLERKGGIELRALELIDRAARTELLPRAQRELWPQDRTQLRVPLPDALPPGAAIELAIVFELRLPSLLARMGRAGDFFMLGQWYPKLAKHERDGRWASFPYHGMGEFYADFADHTLELEVPRGYAIAAPGVPLESREGPGTRIERYQLNAALDVAWAAYPAFRREQMRAGHVQLEVFAPPGHTALARSQLEVMRAGLARLQARLGAYPHDRLVLVLPPGGAAGASGMEYPGLIVGAVASWHGHLGPAGLPVHDLTTTHELAHQWFPMLIASNELAEPMLDEGLSQWLGMDLLRARYGRSSWLARAIGLPFDGFELLRAGFARGRDVPSSLLPAWRYRRPEHLGAAVYARPALVLETVRRTYGDARLWRALGGYARAQRYAHPRLPDLLAAFDAAYHPGFGRGVLQPLLEGRGASTKLKTAAGDGPCETAVLAERIAGGAALPARVGVTRVDGSTREQTWPAGLRSLALECDPQRAGVTVDPQRRNLLDGTRSDDQLRLADRAPQQPWLARLLFWAQLLLGVVGA